MNDEELALIWFDYNGYTFFKVEQILKEFDFAYQIFDHAIVSKKKLSNFDNLKQQLLELDHDRFEEKIASEFYKYGISATTFLSSDFPEKLKTLTDPPLVLYYKGDKSLLTKKSIAVVGTRKPTDYGKIVCEKFVKVLSSSGLVTVSGLAYGIDTIVAEKSLEAGGKTIAVLAGGLDSIYPAQNKILSERVAENGLLISEYRPTIKPQTYAFINRNRLVSGLSLGTLIIEAGKNSGTMSTAKFAIEQSRELFVVPGNINSIQSEGTNNLINEMPDTFTISPERILFRLGIEMKTKTEPVQVGISENLVLIALADGGMNFDDLSDKTNMLPAELSAELIKLEMLGLVKKGNSNTYFKI